MRGCASQESVIITIVDKSRGIVPVICYSVICLRFGRMLALFDQDVRFGLVLVLVYQDVEGNMVDQDSIEGHVGCVVDASLVAAKGSDVAPG